MGSTPKTRSSSFKSFTGTYEEDRGRKTMFDAVYGTMREKSILQRLIVIAQLPRDADRRELGAHYEKLNLQLSKQYMWDNMTGLLLIYPSFLLHVIESSRDILVSVLKDLRDMERQTDSTLVEASKVVFMYHDPPSRMFQQWSYKVLETDWAGTTQAKGVQEEDETTDTLVLTLLSALQNLSKKLEISKKALSELVLDGTLEAIVPQQTLAKLLVQDELLTPQQYLQMYNSHINISMHFGQVIRSSCLTTV
ncbi:testis-expressed protein 47 isoform X2 [Channa argus]|uniref:testis-expressed protein 47 isoform X2 n=1 Tax=Channa argus TaxID=215402 RepID=UPI002944510A|nr:hypothetical protein Q8A73_020938 [Channa argus]